MITPERSQEIESTLDSLNDEARSHLFCLWQGTVTARASSESHIPAHEYAEWLLELADKYATEWKLAEKN